MKNIYIKELAILIVLISASANGHAQEKSIKDLDFLIGTWEVREDNDEKTWWEESTRTGKYILDGTYIELKSSAVSSRGKERTYLWLIHYNVKAQQFEMVSIFSNWHEVLLDTLHWNAKKRKLTIRNDVERKTDEYHERFGEIIFDRNFNKYTWIGENKSGDPDKPSIWKYTEKGVRIGATNQ